MRSADDTAKNGGELIRKLAECSTIFDSQSDRHGIPHRGVVRRVNGVVRCDNASKHNDVVANRVRVTEKDMNGPRGMLVLGRREDRTKKRGRLSAAQDLNLSNDFTSSSYWLPDMLSIREWVGLAAGLSTCADRSPPTPTRVQLRPSAPPKSPQSPDRAVHN